MLSSFWMRLRGTEMPQIGIGRTCNLNPQHLAPPWSEIVASTYLAAGTASAFNVSVVISPFTSNPFNR